jgi:DNA-binding NarL/FixJ family response regulator
MANEIRIVIADDHPIVRKGLREVIEEESDLSIVAEAGDGAACLGLIQELSPAVAILDLHMPKMDGFAAAREIRNLALPVEIIFLTMHDEVDLLHRAMELGKGYILKESALAEVVNGIRSVAAGRRFVSSAMAGALLERRSETQELRRSLPGLAALTPTERRILSMIAEGKPTKAIAAELHVHPRTVETHRSSISQKLQLNGANSLLRFALENRSKLWD